jgi:MFS family permease
LSAFARIGFTRHERRVLSPLALTGFFETYDVALLTLAAPVLAHGLGLGIGVFGICVALIRLASLASVPVLRLADRWGRRMLLLVSLGAFTVATGMTALAVGVVAFVVLQMVARIFQATESSLAGLVIAEELRPQRRGAGISVLGIVSGMGFGAVAGLLLLVPLTPLGWRRC